MNAKKFKPTKAEFLAKREANRQANVKARIVWRLSMRVIRRMKAQSEYQRFGRRHNIVYPFNMPIHPPGSGTTSAPNEVPDEPKVKVPNELEMLEMYKRLHGLLPDPNTSTSLGLGPLPELGASEPVEPTAGTEFISSEIKIRKWNFSTALWLLGGPVPPEEPPP
jgi:hypothetical protein